MITLEMIINFYFPIFYQKEILELIVQLLSSPVFVPRRSHLLRINRFLIAWG